MRHAVVFTALACVLATGCGGDDTGYANNLRPPSPIVISASISDSKISVSPKHFGAGPITLLVANESDQTRELTLQTDEIGGSAPGIRQNSGPINPGDTASLQAVLRTGTYKITVDGNGVSAARLKVGAPRASSQDQLLQP